MTFKPVFRYDPSQLKYRLFRLIWNRGTVGDGKGYSAVVAVSLVPRLFSWERSERGFRIALLGLMAHHRRNFGGIFT